MNYSGLWWTWTAVDYVRLWWQIVNYGGLWWTMVADSDYLGATTTGYSDTDRKSLTIYNVLKSSILSKYAKVGHCLIIGWLSPTLNPCYTCEAEHRFLSLSYLLSQNPLIRQDGGYVGEGSLSSSPHAYGA